MRPAPFHHILANTLVANVTNFTVWFALTFWVFLETRSVFATGLIAGIYLVMTAASGFWFGSLVDHFPKKWAMLGSSATSFALYAAALVFYFAAPAGAMADVAAPWLWGFIVLVMLGVIAGNIRSIALPALVTVLVPEDRRDKANGLVGMVTGIGFLTTSMISGVLVAWGGMVGTLLFALGLSVLAFTHLCFVPLKEARAARGADGKRPRQKVDIAGTIAIVAGVPGLFALIFFASFNNFLGGVFMALMDAYGLSMMKVQLWGLLWGLVSLAFILSGVMIARLGLGRNPLKTLLLVNLISWTSGALFTVQASIPLLIAGCVIWMFLGPYAEAAEQTTLQKVVPPDRQGRVFGFAQSVEQSASPLTAFLIGPLTQFYFIPLMSGEGAGARAIGGWFGTGPARGIALVFCLAGLIGMAVTVLAMNSKYYRSLSAVYAGAKRAEEAPETPPERD